MMVVVEVVLVLLVEEDAVVEVMVFGSDTMKDYWETLSFNNGRQNYREKREREKKKGKRESLWLNEMISNTYY